MRYHKYSNDEYIVAIGTGDGGEEITKEEFDELLSLIKSKPTAEEGYGYRLRKDLTWEKYELPPVEDEPEVEPTTQDDTDSMLIDHEYRLTLLELGV